MGLGVSVGLLPDLRANDAEGYAFFRKQFDVVERVLRDQGLSFREPEVLPEMRHRRFVGSFPYSYVHTLRRALAHLRETGAVVPLPPGEPADPDDPHVDDAGALFDCHLIVHSDAEGFYVPVAFDEVLFDDELAGAMLGSSVVLLRELQEVAPALGIRLEPDGSLSDAEAQRVFETPAADPFQRERCVWLALFEAARLSIAHGTAIAFT